MSPASAVSYTWDDNGNLTDRGSDEFTWDYEDRMLSATVNSVTTTFAYRGDGLRDSRAVSGGATTTFTWDIASGLPFVLDDGNQYVYGAGLTSMKQGGNWYYYLADGLGSTMAVVNASGVVQDSYTYDVYGKPTKTGSLSNEFDFAGQQTDGTGLQYLRARYYDPATGTFLSREPLATMPEWGWNSVGYGAGNPGRLIDPTGLMLEDSDTGGTNQCRHECTVNFDFDGPAWAADNGFYIDINVTLGTGLVLTIGVQIDKSFFESWNGLDDVHFYVGGGVGTSGVSVTVAPGQSPTDGVSCGASATLPAAGPVGPTVQVGSGGATWGSSEKGDDEGLDTPYGEVGIGTAGASATCTAVMTAQDMWGAIWQATH